MDKAQFDNYRHRHYRLIKPTPKRLNEKASARFHAEAFLF
jgi:hypothetical protein